MIKPCSYKNIGNIITCIQNGGFKIGNMKMTKFCLKDALTFYAVHKVIFQIFLLIISRVKDSLIN